MPKQKQDSQNWVLTEEEALTFFAFLVSSARAQMDDPASYASMRILTVFEDMREVVGSRLSKDTRALLETTEEITEKAQVNMLDKEFYAKTLDELNRMLAEFMVARSGLEPEA